MGFTTPSTLGNMRQSNKSRLFQSLLTESQRGLTYRLSISINQSLAPVSFTGFLPRWMILEWCLYPKSALRRLAVHTFGITRYPIESCCRSSRKENPSSWAAWIKERARSALLHKLPLPVLLKAEHHDEHCIIIFVIIRNALKPALAFGSLLHCPNRLVAHHWQFDSKLESPSEQLHIKFTFLSPILLLSQNFINIFNHLSTHFLTGISTDNRA